MKRSILLISFLLLHGLMYCQTAEQRAIHSVERIWDRAGHNAFTDLVYHQGRFFCAFREGSGHIPGLNGSVRVIASEDGMNWYSVAHIAKAGYDLRDPKLSVTPDGRLMTVIGGSVYDGRTFLRRDPIVAFSDYECTRFFDPVKAELPAAIATPTDWLWRVAWHEGYAFGVVYQPNPQQWGLQLVKSRDGIQYEQVSDLGLTGNPNETSIVFLPGDTMLAVVRREGADRAGFIGSSPPPYTSWQWNSLNHQLGGPKLIRLPNGKLLCATRDYTQTDQKTILAFVDPQGNFEPRVTLPSGGDTSYPGMFVKDDLLYVSYYSSHEGKTNIYMARIWWQKL